MRDNRTLAHCKMAIGAGLLSIAASLCGASVFAAEEPKSSISILIDLSETWHNDKSKAANKAVLKTVVEAATEISRHLRPPVHIRMLPIGDASFLRPPLCEALYAPKLISSPNKNTKVFTQEKALQRYLGSDCIEFILTRPKEKFTDITGAIDSSHRLTAAQDGDDRFLIILSDMLEDRPKGQGSIALRLNGYKSIILYRTLNEDRRNPAALDARLKLWEQRLKDAGSTASIVPDEGVVSGQIARLLQK